jgi:hypothetical protein
MSSIDSPPVAFIMDNLIPMALLAFQLVDGLPVRVSIIPDRMSKLFLYFRNLTTVANTLMLHIILIGFGNCKDTYFNYESSIEFLYLIPLALLAVQLVDGSQTRKSEMTLFVIVY